MRTVASTAACDVPVVASPASTGTAATARLADYLALTKPRISVLVLLTVSAGFALGSADRWQAGLYRWSRRVERWSAATFLGRRSPQAPTDQAPSE